MSRVPKNNEFENRGGFWMFGVQLEQKIYRLVLEENSLITVLIKQRSALYCHLILKPIFLIRMRYEALLCIEEPKDEKINFKLFTIADYEFFFTLWYAAGC